MTVSGVFCHSKFCYRLGSNRTYYVINFSLKNRNYVKPHNLRDRPKRLEETRRFLQITGMGFAWSRLSWKRPSNAQPSECEEDLQFQEYRPQPFNEFKPIEREIVPLILQPALSQQHETCLLLFYGWVRGRLFYCLL